MDPRISNPYSRLVFLPQLKLSGADFIDKPGGLLLGNTESRQVDSEG